jgi:hypothetical protein
MKLDSVSSARVGSAVGGELDEARVFLLQPHAEGMLTD